MSDSVTTPESVVIYDGKIGKDSGAFTSGSVLLVVGRSLLKGKRQVEFTIANVTIILDFEEGTIGVLAPPEGER